MMLVSSARRVFAFEEDFARVRTRSFGPLSRDHCEKECFSDARLKLVEVHAALHT